MRSPVRVLALIVVTLTAGALLVACGGDDSSSNGASGTNFPVSSDPAKNIPKDQLDKINLVVAGYDWHVGKNNFVFGITDKNDEPQGGAQAVATFYDLRDQKNPKPVFQAAAVASAPGVHAPTEHVHPGGQVHVHGGEDENRVGYYVTATFDHPGFWGVVVQATLKDGTKGTTNVGFNVFDKPQMPAPGMAALKSDNLTKADVKDIKEIDSGDPPNDMHTVKIKDAIAAHRPMVIVFSTPAFCTSRFCGPVNEEVEDLQTIYRDKVDFIHIEIWRNFDKKELNPTAKEWLLRPDGGLTEPVVYVVDRNGTIYERWEGPVAKNIMEPAVKAVADGQVFAQ